MHGGRKFLPRSDVLEIFEDESRSEVRRDAMGWDGMGWDGNGAETDRLAGCMDGWED